jgi:hypothetical protein
MQPHMTVMWTKGGYVGSQPDSVIVTGTGWILLPLPPYKYTHTMLLFVNDKVALKINKTNLDKHH